MFSSLEKFLLTQAGNAKKLDEMGMPAILMALGKKGVEGTGKAVKAVRESPKLAAGSAALGGLAGYNLAQEDEAPQQDDIEELLRRYGVR